MSGALDFLNSFQKLVYLDGFAAEFESIFSWISDVHYRENYHSDLIAYFIKDSVPRIRLIEWLNKRRKNSINILDYTKGNILREKDNIDITLFSDDMKKAIIIENKSNNAKDQDNQILKYVQKLEENGLIVDAVIYLNKNSLKEPDFKNWKKNEIEYIKEKLYILQLAGSNSFCSEIIDPAILNFSDPRKIGISYELRYFFNKIVFGELNMENMQLFLDELRLNNNYNKLRNAVKAFNDLPRYFANYYKAFIEQSNLGVIPKIAYETNIYIPFTINNTLIHLEFCFSSDKMEIILRNIEGDKNVCEDLNLAPFISVGNGLVKMVFSDVLNDEALQNKIIDTINLIRRIS